MTLQNMRANGVGMMIAQCESCGHTADVNVDPLSERVKVPRPASGCGAAVAA
jgi:hypothetical protein